MIASPLVYVDKSNGRKKYEYVFKGIFYFTAYDKLTPDTILNTPIWRRVDREALVPLGNKKDAIIVRQEFAKAFQSVPTELKKSMTYDQGKEMSEHQQFTIGTGIEIYFSHPGSPWERGTNENTNGLIRQYFPKGTDFFEISVEEIKLVQRKLNDRPRKALKFRKPDEVINNLVALNV